MKNVNLIEANKPSRLKKDNSGKLILLDNGLDFPSYTPMNIYITSYAEIKEGVNQWYLDKFLNKPKNSSGSQYGEKQDVIILTNDRDLIRDNIEPIDDTFLQWFVNNPSCEEVEVESWETKDKWELDYKIIIPKQEICSFCNGIGQVVSSNTISRFKTCDCKIISKEEPKQERVKDLAYWKENAKEDYMKVPISVLRYISELENQKYSKEEVVELLEYVRENFYDTGSKWHSEPNTDYTSKELIKQFNNK